MRKSSGAVGRRQARQFSLLLGGKLHFHAFHHHTGRPLSAQDPPASAAGSSLEGPISQSILAAFTKKNLPITAMNCRSVKGSGRTDEKAE
jgi:hypothetical protein